MNRTRAITVVGGEHSIKEPFEQLVNSNSEHLHRSTRTVEHAEPVPVPTNCCFLQGLYLAVAAGVAGLAGARVVVDPVHAGRLVQARALRTLVDVVLAIRP